MNLIGFYECNLPTESIGKLNLPGENPGQTLLDWVSDGINAWKIIGSNTFVISTILGNSKYVYPQLRSEHPEIKIIGGIKGSHFILGEAIGNPKAWQAMAEECVIVAKSTGQKCCLLENESALWKFNHLEIELPDDKTLDDCLYPLGKTNLTIYWALPTIFLGELETETTRFVKAILRNVPKSVFIMAYCGWGPGWKENRPDFVKAQHKMLGVCGARRTQKMYYVQDFNYWNDQTSIGPIWRTDQFYREAKRFPRFAPLWVYPGQHWQIVPRLLHEIQSADVHAKRPKPR